MPVHTFHGVLDDWSPSRRLDRLYVSRAAFIAALDALPSRYVPAEACEPDQLALTIDDSTMAAAEAALLARERGHEVMLFINPYQIITQRPYFFTVLNLAIDQIAERERQADPKASWRSPHLLTLRQDTRAVLSILDGEALDAALAAFLAHWQIEVREIPDPSRPIDLPTLSRLVDAGVQIGNHGWSHVEIAVMTPEQLLDDVQRTRRWLMDTTGQPIDTYAVPYGHTVPPPEVLSALGAACMLVDSKRPLGQLAPGLINRLDVTDAIAAGRPLVQQTVATPPVIPARWRDRAADWMRRLRQQLVTGRC